MTSLLLVMAIQGSPFSSLTSRLDILIAGAKEPLFVRHLKSVKAISQAEWARAELIRDQEPKIAAQTDQYLAAMRRGFENDAAKWETYLQGKRSLILAYASPLDQSVQWYALHLPKDWDPNKAYPMFMELHGAGDPHPLGWPAAQVGIDKEENVGKYVIPSMHAMRSRDGYHVYPFCRGNLGYRGVAERDVWDVYDEVHKLLKIDPDRRYLYGFSMGGGGTWRLAARTPDRWAAVAIISGATEVRSGDGSGMNLANVPVWIWCGDQDFLYPRVAPMIEELEAHGAFPVTDYGKGIGHAYLAEVQKAAYEWMLKHRRQRPPSFSFAAMDDEYISAWGVTLHRRPGQGSIPIPSVECEVKGQSVILNTEAVGGIEVDLNEFGLKGPVTVVWNEREVYKGSPKKVQSGDVPQPRRRG